MDVGDKALIRGLAIASPIVRPKVSRSGARASAVAGHTRDTPEILRVAAEGWVSFARGDREGALALLRTRGGARRAHRQAPGHAGAADAGARAARRDAAADGAGLSEAQREFEAVQEAEPRRFRAVYGAARAAEAAGDRDAARRHYGQLLEIATRPTRGCPGSSRRAPSWRAAERAQAQGVWGGGRSQVEARVAGRPAAWSAGCATARRGTQVDLSFERDLLEVAHLARCPDRAGSRSAGRPGRRQRQFGTSRGWTLPRAIRLISRFAWMLNTRPAHGFYQRSRLTEVTPDRTGCAPPGARRRPIGPPPVRRPSTGMARPRNRSGATNAISVIRPLRPPMPCMACTFGIWAGAG